MSADDVLFVLVYAEAQGGDRLIREVEQVTDLFEREAAQL